MGEDQIRKYILKNFEGVGIAEDDGNAFFFYDPENKIPFITIVTSNKYDGYSGLDRPDVFRLNIGIGKLTFRSMFPVEKIPTESGYDFTQTNVIMPHPQYGRMYWVCVLNPDEDSFEKLRPMLAEAYDIAVRKYNVARTASLGA